MCAGTYSLNLYLGSSRARAGHARWCAACARRDPRLVGSARRGAARLLPRRLEQRAAERRHVQLDGVEIILKDERRLGVTGRGASLLTKVALVVMLVVALSRVIVLLDRALRLLANLRGDAVHHERHEHAQARVVDKGDGLVGL